MSEAYKPQLAIYFDKLEAKYGENFMFDVLSDEELLQLERHARHAIEQDPKVTMDEKQALSPILSVIEAQRRKRSL